MSIYKRTDSIKISLARYLEHFGTLEQARKSCFNVGAGTWQHDAWTNIDLPAQSEEFARIQAPCIHHNLVQDPKLPIKPETAELIYTSHVIEHLPDVSVEHLFRSAFLSLKSGGTFRIVTGPDADTDWSALVRQDKDWWYFYEPKTFSKEAIEQYGLPSLYDYWLYHLSTPRSIYSSTPCAKKYNSEELQDLVLKSGLGPNELRNKLTGELHFNIKFPGDHLSWWNGQKLVLKLKDAGFESVSTSAYGQSDSVFMRDLGYFDLTYPQISLYVEAKKT